jgi:hypothetical protein
MLQLNFKKINITGNKLERYETTDGIDQKYTESTE